MCEVSKVKFEGKIADNSILVEKIVEVPDAWPKRRKVKNTAVGAFPVLNLETAKAG